MILDSPSYSEDIFQRIIVHFVIPIFVIPYIQFMKKRLELLGDGQLVSKVVQIVI